MLNTVEIEDLAKEVARDPELRRATSILAKLRCNPTWEQLEDTSLRLFTLLRHLPEMSDLTALLGRADDLAPSIKESRP